MRSVKCKNNHYYDAEKYSSCPFCSDGASDLYDVTGATEAFGNGRFGQPGGGSDVTVGFPSDNIAQALGGIQDTISQQAVDVSSFMPDIGLDDGPVSFTPGPQSIDYSNIPPSMMNDSDKTIGFFNTGASAKGMPAENLNVEPAVGWVVCIKGKNIGRDFRLRTGKNYVGRQDNMDIVLKGEMTVARDRHVVIVFEPKQSIYLVQPGDARELAYLNDELILQPKVLQQGDKITVGEVDLLFIPLCSSDGFSWSNYL